MVNLSRKIRLAGIIENSYTDGIGIRFTIFTQGCNHKCLNCQNPETWSFDGGYDVDIDLLISKIKEDPLLDGVTFSGGDPMYQAKECCELAKLIKSETSLNIWCYTGFTFEELIKDNEKMKFMQYIDVLVDGDYQETKRSLSLSFRGSSNQRLIDVRKSLDEKEVILLDI